MSRPDSLPSTAAEAYDLCQEMFGLGVYDDVMSEVPWWKARGLEIARMKTVLKRRRTTPEQIGQACWYARREGIPITYLRELVALVTKAVRAWNLDEIAERHERAFATLLDVVEEAQIAGEHDFVGQLLRADRPGAVRLIEQWRETHEVPTTH